MENLKVAQLVDVNKNGSRFKRALVEDINDNVITLIKVVNGYVTRRRYAREYVVPHVPTS